MEFRKYQHIERFGTSEVEQIEIGTCYVFPKIDGTNNMVKGYCNRLIAQKESDMPLDTILWNSCPYFVPQEVNKIIDINNFRNNS